MFGKISISLCSVRKALNLLRWRPLHELVLGPVLFKFLLPPSFFWAFCTEEGMVCPAVMKMPPPTPKALIADWTKASFKMASSAIKPCLSFIVPCFISDTPDPCFSPLAPSNLCVHAEGPVLCSFAFFSICLTFFFALATNKHKTPNYLKIFSVYRNVLSCHDINRFLPSICNKNVFLEEFIAAYFHTNLFIYISLWNFKVIVSPWCALPDRHD